MNSLAEQCEAFIVEKNLLRRGQKVLVAVSGGVDSMVLLHVLHKLAERHQWKLAVAHFNHQLRGAAADADDKLVQKTARILGLPFAAERGDVTGFAKLNGFSLEMAARNLRHDFLARAARKRNIPTIALAHHADDQVELFFLRLFRGAGSEGLAGMPPSVPSPSDPKIILVRPLLNQPKDALLAFANENGIPFSEDATNACLDIQRNRIRQELIPLLRAKYQPALSRAVARMMDIVGAESQAVKDAAESWLRQASCQPFEELPDAVQRRVLRIQLISADQPSDFELIERLRKSSGELFAVSARSRVARGDDGRLSILPTNLATRFNSRALHAQLSGKQGRLRFGGLEFSWAISARRGAAFTKQGNTEQFDADKVGQTIGLRFWKPGDRFQPSGLPAAAKLQDLFTNAKVSASERRVRVVALTAKGEIFWVQGLRIAEQFKLRASTTRRLKWSWHPA